MPQFTPDSREKVRERLDSQSFVSETVWLDEGLMVCSDDKVQTFSSFTERTGWYVASVEKDSEGYRVVVMPFTGMQS
jgi:hypothetical protein